MITPKQVAEAARISSRTLMRVEPDDLLRELAYRMGPEVRSLTREAYEKAVRYLLENEDFRHRYATGLGNLCFFDEEGYFIDQSLIT